MASEYIYCSVIMDNYVYGAPPPPLIHTHIYIYIRVRAQTVHTKKKANTDTYTTHTHAHTHLHLRTHMRACAHTQTPPLHRQTHRHTHTQSQARTYVSVQEARCYLCATHDYFSKLPIQHVFLWNNATKLCGRLAAQRNVLMPNICARQALNYSN